ncbi:MAG TPA: twin-arginine translocase TatA/TatE family subunit [Chitinispirillaceae bacterium]|nr:twin-arginine translocase TatA/TatE family subunit [Fibrobacter sp.]HLV31124.1 twin-arginine translocase TatA/TatE family subunit [Chitinispirillaceae bacterium]
MGFVGGQELLLIFLIVVLLFGAKKIPELAKGLGNGIREFRKASSEIEKESGNSTEKESKKE